MTKANYLETEFLALIFTANAIPNIADNASSSPLTNLYLSLHTADPGEGGSQTTNEATYTSYARVAVARSGSGWTVASGQAENAGTVTFPEATGGSNTITHVGVGTDAAGAGNLLYSGALTSPRSVTTGIQPTFFAGELVITED